MARRLTSENAGSSVNSVASARLASIPRFALRRDEVAASLGISETTFEKWVAIKRMPEGRKIDGVRLWDVGEVARAWATLRDDDLERLNPFDGIVA